ncbi:MAG TPA: ImmA/IrrE family metallo-endopeptidase [Terriglobia bacterium]|nr:ImmA/IrrE family metallo-endopeptidase [Terriglobia bacterium]
MEIIRVGGKRYTDPDILSLIRATGGLVDPRSAVLNQACELTARLRAFDGVPTDALQRLSVLASMVGIKTVEMNLDQQKKETRDAILLPTADGKRLIIYNPQRPRSRCAFSIAHEIAHTFFPNSVAGARFRGICRSDSKEANELERLCDLGAAELLLPLQEFQEAVASEYSLVSVPRLCERFGSSFEATVFRLASAHPGVAVAGLLRHRLRLGEERATSSTLQGSLFSDARSTSEIQFEAKYRRQSLHLSAACTDEHAVRWNKSFDRSSVVYRAPLTAGIVSAYETLPSRSGMMGRLEAMRAPYQGGKGDPTFPDVLFLWTA